ncbi:MAG: sensor domain-containing diguanylate cyclase/phosphohydrolase [Saccharofermentanales bacterium]
MSSVPSSENHSKILHSAAGFKVIFEQAPIGIAITDTRTHEILHFNKSFARILKRTEEEVYRFLWIDSTHPDDLAADLEYMEKMDSGHISSYHVEKRFELPDHSYVWVSMTIAAIDYSGELSINEKHYICMINDISDQKDNEAHIMYLTYHDPLTGLHNRTYFEKEKVRIDKLQRLPCSVIMGDINNLKTMNDGFGHDYGDRLLKEAARILSDACRPDDTLCRIGGDEFCILMPYTDFSEALHVRDRIYKMYMDYAIRNHGSVFQLSIALGVASASEQEPSLDRAIGEAESAMQNTKLMSKSDNLVHLLESMSHSLFEKSLDSPEHIQRLTEASNQAADVFGLTDNEFDKLVLLSNIHNIGTICLNDSIFFKNEPLSSEEWIEIRKHPEIGYRIAMAIPSFSSVAEMVLSHHERYDGSGYPRRLKGDEIPKLVRIFTILDAYDALCCNKPYRMAMTPEQALLEIARNSGTQFDPELAGKFISSKQPGQ